MTTEKALRFLHMPKCGGSTLAAHFDKFFHVDRITVLLSPRDLLAMPLHETETAEFLRSHAIRLCTRFGPAEMRSLSLMRDPVQRSVSHFQHLLALSRRIPAYQAFSGMSLNDFLRSDLGRAEIQDFQVSMFGCDDLRMTSTLVDPSLCGRLELVKQLDWSVVAVEARAFVENIDYFGTVEGWTVVANAIAADYGFPWLERAQEHRLNRSDTGQQSITAYQRQEIERLVQLDMELYELARSRTAVLRAANAQRAIDARIEYEQQAGRRRSAYYWDFARPFYATDVYQRESVVSLAPFGREPTAWNNAGRKIFSFWGGPGFSFDCWLPDECEARLRIGFDLRPETPISEVELALNGRPLDSSGWCAAVGDMYLVDMVVPAEALNAGFLRVSIRHVGKRRLFQDDGGRQLLVHLQWIEVLSLNKADESPACLAEPRRPIG